MVYDAVNLQYVELPGSVAVTVTVPLLPVAVVTVEPLIVAIPSGLHDIEYVTPVAPVVLVTV